MLAYSANRPAAARRSSSPNMMLAIVGIHVAAVAVLMSAKMDLPLPSARTPLTVEFIEPTPVPPETPVERPREPAARPDQALALPDSLVSLPSLPDAIPVPELPPLPRDPVIDAGPSTGSTAINGKPIAATPAVLLTGPAELKPPYPASKLVTEEEADLKLRLTIDERGGVTAVEPLGRADPTFLSAARRHIIGHWRYRPATTGGRGIATTFVITLRFRLND